MIKDKNFKLDESQKTSSQESFTVDLARQAAHLKASFQRFEQNYRKDSANGRAIKSNLEGFFNGDTIPRRQDPRAERSHLGFMLTPDKQDFQNSPRLGLTNPLFSPKNVPQNSKPISQREMYERRIRQMTRDWGTERTSMRNEIKRLEFIVHQWELLEERKGGNSRTIGSDNRLETEGADRSSLEIARLRRRLEECELEKNEMFRDFMELERELKKVKLSTFEHSGISDFRPQSESSHSEISHRQDKELDKVRTEYERQMLEKDVKYQQLLADFAELQGQLQKERRDTMILLQKRTAELQSNLTNIKVSNQEINSDLRLAIQRSRQQLTEEKERAKLLEAEINLREQNMKLMDEELSEANQNIEQLRQAYLNKCKETEMVATEVKRKEKRVVEVGVQVRVGSGEVSVQACPQTAETWVQGAVEDPNVRRSSAIADSMREQVDKANRRIRQLEAMISERDNRISLVNANLSVTNNNHQSTVRGLEVNISNLKQENHRLRKSVQARTSGIQQSNFTIIRSQSSKSIQSSDGNRQLNELRLHKQLSKQQIDSLRSQLEETRKKLESSQIQLQPEKIKSPTSRDSFSRNMEITLHNLNTELQCAKKKFEGAQTRLDIKTRQLKDKDEFIRNTIVSRVGKGVSQTQVQFFVRKMDEFMDLFRQRQKTK